MMTADASWELSDEKITVEILGPEKGEVPSGEIFFEQEGLVARWKPSVPVIMKRKKRNALNSPWVSEIFFRENVAKSKALGAPAPYYALDEIKLRFTEPVSSNVIQGEKSLKLEFRPLKKRKLVVPEEAPLEEKKPIFSAPPPSSPNDILGSVYRAKTEYEIYTMGESRAAETLKRFQVQRGPRKELFDGGHGFPKNMGQVFEEAYPSFGSLEYWKKYVRAVFDQTTGFSSDYDGNYGAFGGFRADNPAMTWKPDLAVRYFRPGVISPSVGYHAQRVCPVSRLLHFADGRQDQTISFGAGYSSQKPYEVFSENSLSFFRDKTLSRDGKGGFNKTGNKGLRMTNALGLNYRLTQRLLWKISGGLEATRSEGSNSGRSRTNTGYLSNDLGYSLSKKLSAGLGYSYRHIFKNTSSSASTKSATFSKNAKDKNLQAPSIGLRYQPFQNLVLAGSITPAIIDGQYYKFGGEASLKYQRSPADDFSFSYSNAAAQDDTAQLTGRSLGGIGSAGNVQILRNERIALEYNYWFVKQSTSKMNLKLSLSYQKNRPLSGLSSNAGNLADGMIFEAALRRKLRGGKMWLEIAYRFSNYHQKGLGLDDTLDSSLKEHAVFFSTTNYFGN